MNMLCFVGDGDIPVDPRQHASFLKHIEEARQMDEGTYLSVELKGCQQKQMHFARAGDILMCCCDDDIGILGIACIIDEEAEGQPFRNWLSCQLLKAKTKTERQLSKQMNNQFINSLLEQGLSGSSMRQIMDAIQFEPVKMFDGLFHMRAGHLVWWVNDYLDNKPELKRAVFSPSAAQKDGQP